MTAGVCFVKFATRLQPFGFRNDSMTPAATMMSAMETSLAMAMMLLSSNDNIVPLLAVTYELNERIISWGKIHPFLGSLSLPARKVCFHA